MERKFTALQGVKAEGLHVSGYASVFGGVDSYGDTIVKGAYLGTIKEAKRAGGLEMLWQHNTDNLIGRWTSLEEDDRGLLVTGELTPGHTLADNIRASLSAGHLSGLSIGFSVPPGGAAETPEGGRMLKKIHLHEVSFVSKPADNMARGGLKAADMEYREFRKLIERAARDAGVEMSRSEAEAFMANGFKGLTAMRDAGGAVDADAALKAALLDAIRLNPNR